MTLPSLAVLLSPSGGRASSWAALAPALAAAGVRLVHAGDPTEAAEALFSSDANDAADGDRCLLADAGDHDGVALVARLSAVRAAAPWASPVVVATDADGPLAIAAIRGGAVDVVAPGDSEAVLAALAHAATEQRDRLAQRRAVASLRAMVEDFLRVLVQTERRSIDLEHQLSRRDRNSGTIETVTELDGDRAPCVFVVVGDRELADTLVDDLEASGVTTFAFVSGEEAVGNAARMATRGEPVDLLLSDVDLPGFDGLETIRRIRQLRPWLAAMLVSRRSDAAAAEAAADLGVVGFVQAPVQDTSRFVERVRHHAEAAMARSREHHYLRRIKQRHDHVLQRYRALAADLDRDLSV